MKSRRIFASIMFTTADRSSGIDYQELDYDPAVTVKEYADFFLEQTKIKYPVKKAKVFEIELSEHDKNGEYLLDEFKEIKRRSISAGKRIEQRR